MFKRLVVVYLSGERVVLVKRYFPELFMSRVAEKGLLFL